MSRFPVHFERATGVVEQVRQCMAKGCRRLFRIANEHETACPYCGSTATYDLRQSRPKVQDDHSRNSE